MGKAGLFVALLMVMVACGDAATPETQPSAPATSTAAPATTTTTTTTTTSSTSTSTTAAPPTTVTPPGSPAQGVAVAITGVVRTGPDGVAEVCPRGYQGSCPGVAVAGDLPAGLSPDAVYRLTGSYDGATLTITAPPREISPEAFPRPDFSAPCPGLVAGGEDVGLAVHEYVSTVPDSYAGRWWDAERSLLTVWFTDADPSRHEEALDAATGGAPVCVIGGAFHTEAELHAAQDAAVHQFADRIGMHWASTDVVRNLVEIEAEHVDRATLDAIAGLSEAIEVHAFIEVLDGTVADLPEPVPVRPGDVELRTDRLRAAGGMGALGTFTLRYDDDLACFYLEWPDETRVSPIWPFGFTGDSGPPPTVYDWDGRPFAAAGDRVELGGGAGGIPPAGPEGCGATESWAINHPG